MKLLTKNSDYAVRALLHLATRKPRGDFIPSRAIAEQGAIPEHFLRRILRTLIKADYIEAREGIKGGVRLARKPDKIALSGILELFQGRIQLSECLFRRKVCPNRADCVLRHRIKSVEDLVTREFSRITIADLVKDMSIKEK